MTTATLGKGLRSPVRPDDTGAIPFVDNDEIVRQSIDTILDTEPGERVMLPAFGCALRRYLMEPNTVTMRAAMKVDIEEALSLWEPRIRLTDVTVSAGDEPSLVFVEIAYVHLLDQRPANLVYPFYLR